MLKIKPYLSVLILVSVNALAQKTALFNGKTYLIYPGKLEYLNNNEPLNGTSNIENLHHLKVSFPSILDSLADGNYLLYFLPKRRYHTNIFGIRNYSKQWTDSFNVYGTFEIKNGKKNGPALIYDNMNQKQVIAKLNFKNDALEGVNTIFVDFYKWHRIVDINYQNGIMNGVNTVKIAVGKRDTMPVTVWTMKDGLENGSYKDYHFHLRYRKVKIDGDYQGTYSNGKKNGIWLDSYKNNFVKYYYLNDVITRIDEYEGVSQKLVRIICFGKDSILKYVKSVSQDSLMPFVQMYSNQLHYNYKYNNEDFIVLKGNPDKSCSVHFYKIKDYVSKSYFNYSLIGKKGVKEIRYVTTDTVMNHLLARVTKIYHDKALFSESLAVIEKENNSTSEFIINELRFRKFKNNQLIKENLYSSYFYYFPKDSLVPELLYANKGRKFASESYFQKALSYEFTNERYYQNGKLKLSFNYQVKGDNRNGSIIKYSRVYGKIDSMIVSDTLMSHGKWLYKTDDLLYNSMRESRGSNKLFDFANFATIKHAFFRYGSSGFYGKLKIENEYSAFGKRIRIIEPNDDNDEFKIAVNNRYFRSYNYGDYRQRKLSIQGGLLDDILSFDYGNITAEYRSNILNGEVDFINNKYYNSRRSTFRYINGQKDGLCSFNLYRRYDAEVHCNYIYHKDLLDGLQIEDHKDYKVIYYRSKGILNGSAMQLVKSGYPLTSGAFKDGKPNGIFTRYFGQDTLFYRQRCEFKKGILCGEYAEYSYENELRFKIKFNPWDSFFNDKINDGSNLNGGDYSHARKNSYYYLNDSFFYVDKWFEVLFEKIGYQNGDYTYYYKNGDVFKFGAKMDNQPVDLWQFYREGGDRIYKRIVFNDSIMVSETMDSIPVFGLTHAYYDDGKLMFKGLALDNKVKYSCESDSEVPVEEDYYLEFYDTLGKPMLINGSGFISELQANGNKLKEGRLENYQKQGLWIYYSKFGLPEAIGMFKDGKRVGRWLQGDLGGLNLNERICYMNEDEFRNWIETSGKDIELTELYYVKGELISSNSVKLTKK